MNDTLNDTTGHLGKTVPFLGWFERTVGEENDTKAIALLVSISIGLILVPICFCLAIYLCVQASKRKKKGKKTKRKLLPAEDEEMEIQSNVVDFMLEYAMNRQNLIVHVVKGLDLKKIDKKHREKEGPCDPFVEVYLGTKPLGGKADAQEEETKHYATRVIESTPNPVWNEQFSFVVPFGDIPSTTVHLDVFNNDNFGNNVLMGKIACPLRTINLVQMLDASMNVRRPLMPGVFSYKGDGQLHVGLKLSPDELAVTVLEARHLRVNPSSQYAEWWCSIAVELIIADLAIKDSMKETRRRLKTNAPYFSETFLFPLPQEFRPRASLVFRLNFGEEKKADMVSSFTLDSTNQAWARLLNRPHGKSDAWYELKMPQVQSKKR